jgi:hypothetical protein
MRPLRGSDWLIPLAISGVIVAIMWRLTQGPAIPIAANEMEPTQCAHQTLCQ